VLETVVLHSIEPESKEVKTLYDVFSWGQEATAEYLFFGEIDKQSLKPDGTGDVSQCQIRASVDVSFESDVLEVAKNQIQMSTQNSLAPDLESLSGESPDSIIQIFNDNDMDLLIDSGNDFCSLLCINTHGRNVWLKYVAILEDRVTNILVMGAGHEKSAEWLVAKYLLLVSKYKDIPYSKFSGAIRE
jgi:hypothetical protein